MGRQAAGVTAMRLAKGDNLTSMDVVDAEGELLVVTVNGYGKRTPLTEYTPKGRATGGIATLSKGSMKTTGPIASARVVRQEDEITIISTGGQALRTKVKEIRQAGRATMGTRLINLKKDGDIVASVARLAAKDIIPLVEEPARKNGKAEKVAQAELLVAESVGGNGQPGVDGKDGK
jgi:DNA gyrase subunit A